MVNRGSYHLFAAFIHPPLLFLLDDLSQQSLIADSLIDQQQVCRIQAQVFIKGAGSVSLSWYTKKKPL